MAEWKPPDKPIEATAWVPPDKPIEGPSRMDRLGTGMLDPAIGAMQFMTHASGMGEMGAAGLTADDAGAAIKGVDERVQKREAGYQAERKAGGQTGIDWWRLGGNVISPVTAPLMAIPGGGIAASETRMLGRAGLGAALGGGVGAAGAMMQPVPGANFVAEKTKQAAEGAVVGGVVGGAAGALTKGIIGDTPAEIEKFIENAYDKAIRPTVVGKGTAQKIDAADQNVLSGLSSIIDNKANLRLADKNGKEVIGRSPQTLDEFVQAIAQTKRPVFDRYDALARQAEGLGVRIDANPAVDALRRFAADPSFNLPKYAGMREYATKTADSLAAQGELPPTVAQSMVRNLNEGLSAFYRASSPEAASRAAVDDLVAHQLRSGVDTALSKAGLPGWQEARNAYGALKAIENEVAHRAVVYGRQDPGGGLFGRIGSIATYEELARFATTFDPTALASAVAIRGGRRLTEWMNGPNRAVRRMFEKAEELQDKNGPVLPPAPAITGGMQPPRPSGPSQNLSGTQGGGSIQSGGRAAPKVIGPRPMGVKPLSPIDPFLTPPYGGRVSMGDDDRLARALGHLA